VVVDVIVAVEFPDDEEEDPVVVGLVKKLRLQFFLVFIYSPCSG
jgi:hypothetical protein